ncbi:MAG TPA: S-methyl-5-thioribose-1-phosphate isomerase [bacterium]|nr:S-methyl-5-thioribose-1-phosphate isomerase [bacterium]
MDGNTGLRAAYWEGDEYVILDQLELPGRVSHLRLTSPAEVREAIVSMRLRGAPLIGAAASAGAALAFRGADAPLPRPVVASVCASLASARPTAVNLTVVLDEMLAFYDAEVAGCASGAAQFALMQRRSLELHWRDRDRNRRMARHGADRLRRLRPGRKLRVLTHCNTGALATCGYGTALGVIRALHEDGALEMVWVDETRPYLQGARLTAFECAEEGMPHTVITDSTAAFLMARGLIDAVIVGADRMARTGDVANKIGTYGLAVSARHHGIPFLVALPVESFDPGAASGQAIVIEERSDDELLVCNGRRIAPVGTRGLHLGFDVTPGALVSAVVTEHGVLEGPIQEEHLAVFMDHRARGGDRP